MERGPKAETVSFSIRCSSAREVVSQPSIGAKTFMNAAMRRGIPSIARGNLTDMFEFGVELCGNQVAFHEKGHWAKTRVII